MIWFIIIVMTTAVITLAVTAIVTHRKQTEFHKIYTAAGNILREDYLNYALKNHTSELGQQAPSSKKIMVYIRVVSGKSKQKYIFDPDKEISIGRDVDNSNIYINNMNVSAKHCKIYSEGGCIILEDMNSANGTIIKRRKFKRYHLANGYRLYLKTGDIICVGSSQMKIMVFFYDMSTM